MKNYSFGVVIAVILSLSFSTSLFAQLSENPISISSNIGSDIEGYFYQDPMSSFLQATYESLESITDLSSYTLGPSDVISVSIDAIRPITLRGLYVNPQGFIVAPIVGQINVQGLTIEETKGVISKRVDEILKDFEIQISLDYPRPPTIFVNGSIPFSGRYIVSPFSRVDAAIYPALVENEISNTLNPVVPKPSNSDLLNTGAYSFRNIKIIRNNSDTLFADMYSFFRAGDLTKNPIVYDGDRILINKINRQTPKISISGAIINSIELEYNEYDTPSLIIDLAGGLQQIADKSELFVYRNSEKLIVASESWDSFRLIENDRIVIPRSSSYNQNAVAHIYGEVSLPGTFPINSGQTSAKELIDFAEGLSSQALLSAAYLMRGQSIENQVDNKFNIESLKRTSDQLEQGFSYLEMETRNSRNKVFLDLTDEETLDDIKLFNGDRIFVPLDEKTVFIFGQVNEPGYYNYSSTTSVFDYIQRAGGYALSADRDRTFVLKAGNNTWYSPNETELESGDKIFVDREPFEELNALRTYEVQKGQLKNSRIQLIMTGITTITGIITTYVAIQNRN